jgi:hypothetical protein
MKSKHLFPKRGVALLIGAAIILSLMSLCGVWNSNELCNQIQNRSTVTLTMAKPTAYTISVKGKQMTEDSWIQLDQIKTYNKFRIEFDKLFNINIITKNGVNGKSGCLYVDSKDDRNGNTTISDAFRNQRFVEKYWNDTDVQHGIMSLTHEAYSDVKESDEDSLMASLNAYYNLLDDASDPSSFNPTESVSRRDFMAMVYKATTPVNTEYSKGFSTDDPFIKSVGDTTIHTLFARVLKDAGFLKFSDGSLNNLMLRRR